MATEEEIEKADKKITLPFSKKRNWIKTNLNHYIKVRLTDYGIKIYQESFTKYGLPLPKINYDENGYVEFQIHVFISKFGNYIGCGKKMPCYPDIKIQYYNEDQEDIEDEEV